MGSRFASAVALVHSRGTPADDKRTSYECDHCGRPFDGIPGGSGLLIWTRGDEVRYEEPPLCEECAAKISVGALMRWEVEEEEEG
jgi:hypothetical protein